MNKWNFRRSPDDLTTFEISHYDNIKTFPSDGIHIATAHSESSARLIAAAPDMLYALKITLESIDQDSNIGVILNAVIAKAEGRI